MQAVIFDLDDTLVVDETANADALLKTCALAAERVGADALKLRAAVTEESTRLWSECPATAYCRRIGTNRWEALWAEYRVDSAEASTLREWARHYRLEVWLRVLKRFVAGTAPLAAEMVVAFRQFRQDMIVVFDDVVPTLKALKPVYRLGILTNGPSDIQWHKIKCSGIADYFSAVAVSGDVGYGKPGTQIFEHILNMLNVNAKDTAMVGNSLEADIRGALGSGLLSVWLNRSHAAVVPEIVPDIEIYSLRELQERLECY